MDFALTFGFAFVVLNCVLSILIEVYSSLRKRYQLDSSTTHNHNPRFAVLHKPPFRAVRVTHSSKWHCIVCVGAVVKHVCITKLPFDRVVAVYRTESNCTAGLAHTGGTCTPATTAQATPGRASNSRTGSCFLELACQSCSHILDGLSSHTNLDQRAESCLHHASSPAWMLQTSLTRCRLKNELGAGIEQLTCKILHTRTVAAGISSCCCMPTK